MHYNIVMAETVTDVIRFKITKEIEDNETIYYANVYNSEDKDRKFLLDTYKYEYKGKNKQQVWKKLQEKHNFTKYHTRRNIWIAIM